jgi:hypothetical protein
LHREVIAIVFRDSTYGCDVAKINRTTIRGEWQDSNQEFTITTPKKPKSTQ